MSPGTRERWLRGACLAPAMAVFGAFWLLPMAWLAVLPAQQGWATYAAVLTQPRYLSSLLQTTALSLAVTAATLLVGSLVGLFLGRTRFPGRALLLSLLTLPMSFPGVVVGFFVIMAGGRQGAFALLSQWLGWSRWSFAYGLTGLFLAYLYFSLPRTIGHFAAASQALDSGLEDAARMLGARPWQVARDVWLPALTPTAVACGAIVFATAMGAFGTAFTLSSRFEVLPISIYNEFTNYANFPLAASLSLALGLMTWLVLFACRQPGHKGALA